MSNTVELSDFTPSLPGDFDLDNDADGFDFLRWQRGESPNSGNESDFEDWENNFGAVLPAVATGSNAVPEPNSLALLCLGGLLALRRFHRATAFALDLEL